MDGSHYYFRQVELLIKVLPHVVENAAFALKGGTAINLFYQNMPRLSVDIDLTYLPLEKRDKALKSIEALLTSSASKLKKVFPESKTELLKSSRTNLINKMFVKMAGVQVKIEPNEVLRSTLYPPEDRELQKRPVEMFKTEVEVSCVSFGDLYGGKICAALDRQHPRDLFDVKFLLENEGITTQVRKGFLAYLLSSNRPMAELLDPQFLPIEKIFETEFANMTFISISAKELASARATLVRELHAGLTDNERRMLLSFKLGEPQWELFGEPGIQELPGIKWKLQNLKKMDARKHAAAVNKLKRVLSL